MSAAPRTLVLLPPSLYRLLFDECADRDLRRIADVTFQEEERRLDAGELADRLPGQEIVVTGWGTPRLADPALRQADRLRLVAHSAGTVKPFVSPELFHRGVRVTQANDAMAIAVAEHCLALCLAMLRYLPSYDRSLRAGEPWQRAQAPGFAYELASSRVGVVGASRTGTAFIRMVTPLAGEVVVSDPYLSDERAAQLGVRRCGLEELLRTSRVVALHAPSTPATHHMVGATELSWMPDGAILVNTARSWLVDEAALRAELASGRITAAIDVFDQEPLPEDSPWRHLDGAFLTPHVAGATFEARRRQGDAVVEEIRRYVQGLPPRREVRREDLETVA
ncbi:MAG: hydroxyacid dehydrogenase [Candidatus Dormibacteraeota bacterium]|nr:hydroxyacid dehydrogenase [Candidatus Dormibacteraeota bacterium]